MIPDPIEPIHFDQPRAVLVRGDLDKENLNNDVKHSAVSGRMNVYVETQKESDAILAAWNIIMQSAADKANEILNAMRVSPPQEPVSQ